MRPEGAARAAGCAKAQAAFIGAGCGAADRFRTLEPCFGSRGAIVCSNDAADALKACHA
jgi:hypothetical protein